LKLFLVRTNYYKFYSSCYTEYGRYLTVCRNCGLHKQCWVCMVCREISLLLNMADMDRWKTVKWAIQSTLFT